MLPYQMIAGGTFLVTAGTAVDVVCQSQNPPDFVVARNLGSTAATGWGELNDAQEIEWFWERSMAQATAKGIRQTSSGTDPAMISTFVSSDGISTYDTTNPPTFTGVALTDITAIAGTFIVEVTSSASYAVGDYVRILNPTGTLQIGGYTFQITAIPDGTHITLGYMASGGVTFAADATAGTVVKFIPNRFYPRWKYIAGISQAAQAVVYFTATNDFTPGEIVSFRVSSDFGMDEINNVQARVLSVTNSATESSITIDLDTTGFTAFDFPTSAQAAAGVSPAVCVPSSSGVVPFMGSATIPQEPPGTNLLDAFDNRNVRIIHFGGTLFTNGTTGDRWMWQAFKYDQYNGS